MKNTFNNIKHTLANMQIDWPSTQPLTHQSKHQAQSQRPNRNIQMGQPQQQEQQVQSELEMELIQARQRLIKYSQQIEQQKNKRRLLDELLAQPLSNQQLLNLSASHSQSQLGQEYSVSAQSIQSSEYIAQQFSNIQAYMKQMHMQQISKQNSMQEMNRHKSSQQPTYVHEILKYDAGTDNRHPDGRTRTRTNSIFKSKKPIQFHQLTQMKNRAQNYKSLYHDDDRTKYVHDYAGTQNYNRDSKWLARDRATTRQQILREKQQAKYIQDKHTQLSESLYEKYQKFMHIKQKYEDMNKQNQRNILYAISNTPDSTYNHNNFDQNDGAFIKNPKQKKAYLNISKFMGTDVSAYVKENNVQAQEFSQIQSISQGQLQAWISNNNTWIVDPLEKRHLQCVNLLKNQDRKYRSSLQKTKNQQRRCSKLINKVRQAQIFQKLKK